MSASNDVCVEEGEVGWEGYVLVFGKGLVCGCKDVREGLVCGDKDVKEGRMRSVERRKVQGGEERREEGGRGEERRGKGGERADSRREECSGAGRGRDPCSKSAKHIQGDIELTFLIVGVNGTPVDLVSCQVAVVQVVAGAKSLSFFSDERGTERGGKGEGLASALRSGKGKGRKDKEERIVRARAGVGDVQVGPSIVNGEWQMRNAL